MTNPTKAKTHEKAVEYTACNLIENGIPTRNGTTPGIDLVLNNGKTIMVRGMNEELAVALMNGSLDSLKADYVIGVTNLKYRCIRQVYIMSMDKAKEISDNSPYKDTGRNNWFINPVNYRPYRNDFDILRD